MAPEQVGSFPGLSGHHHHHLLLHGEGEERLIAQGHGFGHLLAVSPLPPRGFSPPLSPLPRQLGGGVERVQPPGARRRRHRVRGGPRVTEVNALSG